MKSRARETGANKADATGIEINIAQLQRPSSVETQPLLVMVSLSTARLKARPVSLVASTGCRRWRVTAMAAPLLRSARQVGAVDGQSFHGDAFAQQLTPGQSQIGLLHGRRRSPVHRQRISPAVMARLGHRPSPDRRQYPAQALLRAASSSCACSCWDRGRTSSRRGRPRQATTTIQARTTSTGFSRYFLDSRLMMTVREL